MVRASPWSNGRIAAGIVGGVPVASAKKQILSAMTIALAANPSGPGSVFTAFAALPPSAGEITKMLAEIGGLHGEPASLATLAATGVTAAIVAATKTVVDRKQEETEPLAYFIKRLARRYDLSDDRSPSSRGHPEQQHMTPRGRRLDCPM
jgi:hypothetical protein